MGMTMVIARMDAEKIERGNRVLAREGLTASEAVNLMYDRLIADQSAAFLIPEGEEPARQTGAWQANVVDTISEPCTSRFDDMSRAEIKADRLRSRGLL